MPNNQQFYNDVAKASALLVIAYAGCHFFTTGFALLLAAVGIISACSPKKSIAIAIFVFVNICIMSNTILIRKAGFDGIIYRATPLIIGLLLAASPKGRYVIKLPFGMIFIYLGVAAISSASGWVPIISYLKLLNFIIFFIGIWVGTQCFSGDIKNLYMLRVFFVSLCTTVIIGSLIASRFPNIGYSISVGVRDAETAAFLLDDIQAAGGLTLFSGIFNQSQVLGVVLSGMIAYLLCDMLLIERRISKFHLVIVVLALVETYMSRARVGLFSTCIAIFMVFIKPFQEIQFAGRLKERIRTAAQILVVLIISGSAVMEIRNHSITRWIYKSNDLTTIEETNLIDAVVTSRKGLVEENMKDFRENKLLGKGFQVSRDLHEKYRNQGNTLVLTAPIEKGLLPLMILGETGIIGAVAFIVFLLHFYSDCAKYKLPVSSIMLTVFLATNIGEATFFSTGGIGGLLWAFCIIGGYSLDLLVQATTMPPPRVPHYPMPQR